MDVRESIEKARREHCVALDEETGKAVLGTFGIPVPRVITFREAGEAETAFAGLTPPLVLKGVSPDVIHKSEFGAVKIDLRTINEVRAAAEEIGGAIAARGGRFEGYLLEEMAPLGHELIIGGLTDPQFGPLVMVGLGGIFIEVFADVGFGICPIGEADAREMLAGLKALPLLRGARGRARANEDAIVDVLLKVGGEGGLMVEFANDIAELDINPLIVSETGAVAVDARLVLGIGAPDMQAKPAPSMSNDEVRAFYRPLFAPRTIGVIGASATRKARANIFMEQCRELGFKGSFYPIHPKAAEIEGCKAYSSLGQTPEPIDYAFVAIPAAGVPDVIRAAKGNARFAHVMSAGFAETEEGGALQDDLVAAGREGGVRLLGPNCNGGYSPRGGVTFVYRSLPEVGSVGVFSQSGGMGIDVIRHGYERGLRFSGVMTLGNCADLGPSDLLEFYLADPETRVIGCYMEGLAQARRFYELLRFAAGRKPVVILKGGRTEQGERAAFSHTGMLAGDDRVCQALSAQTGAVLVNTLVEFLDALLAFQMLTPRPARPTGRAALFGNGGGTGVLAVDAFARLGVDVVPFNEATRAGLKALELAPGTSVTNPIDAPIFALTQEEGRIAEKVMEVVYALAEPEAFVMHVNLPVLWTHVQLTSDADVMGNLLETSLRVHGRYPGKAHFLLVLRSNGAPDIEERKAIYRMRALAAGIPVYDELANAATAVAAIGHYERWLGRERRSG